VNKRIYYNNCQKIIVHNHNLCVSIGRSLRNRNYFLDLAGSTFHCWTFSCTTTKQTHYQIL